MTYFKNNIALAYGIKSAIVAQYLWESMYVQVRDAIDKLSEKKVIQKGCFNHSRFDHTNWYCFTEYGKSLMLKSEGVII